jgi:predicted metal-dependent phosphoesterase TrpH
VLSVELHCHSALSYDGRDPVDLILDQARAVGLDVVAVTDHDEFDASLTAAKRAPDYGLVGIPAMEITSAAGHVLGIGLTEPVPPGLSFVETVERVHEQGGVVVVPHPFQRSRHGVAHRITRDELARADAIEVYNSRLFTGHANRRARAFARRRNLPMTAGSDAHIAELVGQAVTLVDASECSVGGVLDALLAGRTEVVGRRTPWHISGRQFATGVLRRVKRAILGAL